MTEIFSKELTFFVLKNHIIISENNRNPEIITETKTDSSIEISGKIIDKKTKKPIPFISVGILNTSLGTAANQTGKFRLKLPDSYIDSTIYFADLGYKNLYKNNTLIKLEQEYISIEEVIIRNKNPENIILKTNSCSVIPKFLPKFIKHPIIQQFIPIKLKFLSHEKLHIPKSKILYYLN